MKKLTIALLTICCMAIADGAAAQENAFEDNPSYMLVQLRAEKHKLDYLRSRNPGEAKNVAEEAAAVRQVMINDFTDHFSRCPVYYYMDSNADKIKSRQFEGVLFTADMKPVTNLPDKKNNHYYIVYYGRPSEDKYAKTSNYTYDNSERNGKGLIFLKPNYEYANIYLWQLEYKTLFVRKDKKYYYNSKKYDMGYFPLAKVLQGNGNTTVKH